MVMGQDEGLRETRGRKLQCLMLFFRLNDQDEKKTYYWIRKPIYCSFSLKLLMVMGISLDNREKKLSRHPFLKLYKQSWEILFNIFAKNEAKKYNSKVYAAKKRQPGAAGDAANRKIKKLQSNSESSINKMLPKP